MADHHHGDPAEVVQGPGTTITIIWSDGHREERQGDHQAAHDLAISLGFRLHRITTGGVTHWRHWTNC